MAHKDQPVREGKLHISAPHIYGTVLEALDLPDDTGSTWSFLNIGSGTGYLSCLVAEILGPAATCYGIELQKEVLAHCEQALAAWKEEQREKEEEELAYLQFVQGNGLEIDGSTGEPTVGFDRIYIGAAVDRRDLVPLANLLRPNGVLVGPGEYIMLLLCLVVQRCAGVPNSHKNKLCCDACSGRRIGQGCARWKLCHSSQRRCLSPLVSRSHSVSIRRLFHNNIVWGTLFASCS